MRGRRVPPVIPIPVDLTFALPRAEDPSRAIDAAYFESHPNAREYMRMYIPGETVKPMDPDTWVAVMLIDGERVRGFAPPPERGLN